MVGEYNRDISKRKALRKRRIARKLYRSWNSGNDWEYYNNLHEYSKGKIHCSCPNCSPKTRNKGRRNKKNYDRAIHYKYSELQRQISMDEEELEYQSFNKGSKRKHER